MGRARRTCESNQILCGTAINISVHSKKNQQRNISPVNRMTCRSLLLWPTAQTVRSTAKKVLFSRMHVFFASFSHFIFCAQQKKRNTLADERLDVGQLVAFSWAVWDSQSQQSARQHVAASHTIAISICVGVHFHWLALEMSSVLNISAWIKCYF